MELEGGHSGAREAAYKARGRCTGVVPELWEGDVDVKLKALGGILGIQKKLCPPGSKAFSINSIIMWG